MFSGIINATGLISSVKDGRDRYFRIITTMDLSDIEIGASISCSGVCLTIMEFQSITKGEYYMFKVMACEETLSLTTAKDWSMGTVVNLERSLKFGQEVGGHMVTGHIDGTIRILEIEQVGDSYICTFELPKQFRKFIAKKGSVAINGISLTVSEVREQSFSVYIIPHTFENTNIGLYGIGDLMNLEIDVFARYVVNAIDEEMLKKEVANG